MKINSFIIFGVFWMLIGGKYANQLNVHFGVGMPANPSEWLGEIWVGQCLMLGTVMFAIGRCLGGRK